jgi:uncharacterized membrane protein
MKNTEIHFKNGAMILSFLYAGISLVLFIIFLTSINSTNHATLVGRLVGRGVAPSVKPLLTLMLVVTGFGTVSSFIAGLALMKETKQQVITHVEQKKEEENNNHISPDLLTEDEKTVIKCLQDNNNSMSQRDLSSETKLGNVKVHRIIKRLEKKKVISKYNVGITNRIKLEKGLKE